VHNGKLELTFIDVVFLLRTLILYTIFMFRKKKSLFGCVSERRIVNGVWKHNNWFYFLHYIQLSTICSDDGSLLGLYAA